MDKLKARIYKDLEKYRPEDIPTKLVDFSMGEQNGVNAYFISREYILDNFTLNDLFEKRGSTCPFEELESIYNTEWFEDNKLKLPEFCHIKYYGDRNTYTSFNVGRHRTIILMRYMDKIPILYNKKSSDTYFVKFDIPKEWQPIQLHTKIEIPLLKHQFLGQSGSNHCK